MPDRSSLILPGLVRFLRMGIYSVHGAGADVHIEAWAEPGESGPFSQAAMPDSKSSRRSVLGQTPRHDPVSRHRRSTSALDHSVRRPGGTGGRPRFHGVWHPLRFRSCGTIGAVKRCCVRPGIGAVTRVCCRAGVSAFPIANAVAGVLLIKFHGSFPG